MAYGGRPPDALGQENVRAFLLRLVVERHVLPATHRIHVAALNLYGAGLRISEVCGLEVRDVDGERLLINVRQAKGGRDRDVLLSPRLWPRWTPSPLAQRSHAGPRDYRRVA